jgi:hypothetical protein
MKVVRILLTLALGSALALWAPAQAADAAPATRSNPLLSDQTAGRGAVKAFDAICGYYYIIAKANNRYVSVRKNLTGERKNMLRASATKPDRWEVFQLCYDRDLDFWYIYHPDTDLYVSARLTLDGAHEGMLRAETHEVRESEKFRLFDCDALTCNIQSMANGLYVSARKNLSGDDKGLLRASVPLERVSTWEAFTFKLIA